MLLNILRWLHCSFRFNVMATVYIEYIEYMLMNVHNVHWYLFMDFRRTCALTWVIARLLCFVLYTLKLREHYNTDT